MSCIKSIFRCNFSDRIERDSSFYEKFCEKKFEFLRQKIIDVELDMKSFKIAHELEIKRIEDKLANQIQMLSTKIDSVLLLATNN